MSTSELHSRLEHLVSYSSQLIFVSNNKISQQSKIVEAFLGQQAENTEVAIIDAKQTTFLQDYRSQLFKQLIGTATPADFERPLNQLLSALDEYEGPVLIIVSHADNLPQKFLQELWELVLQSRFVANKQHLNVLLFAHSEWAEEAKKWLPTSNGNKPIVLYSESILGAEADAANQNGQTDLEQLICAKREQFAERIRDRESSYETIQPILHKPWLAGLMIILFISVFSGMLYSQYSEVANNWWKLLGSTFSASSDDSSTTEQGATSPEETNATAKLVDISTIPEMQDTSSLVRPALPQPLVEELIPVVSDRLITDWKNVVKQIDKATTSRLMKSGPEQLDKPPIILNASLTAETIARLSGTGIDKAIKSQSAGIFKSYWDLLEKDYKVEGSPLIEQFETGLVKVQSSSPSIAVDAEKSNRDTAGQEATLKFSYDETTLLTLPPNRYLLQVAATGDPLALQAYIQQNQLQDQLWVYKTQRNGLDWFVLLHNQSYLSASLAKQAVNSLPQALRQSSSFVKTSKQVSQEINGYRLIQGETDLLSKVPSVLETLKPKEDLPKNDYAVKDINSIKQLETGLVQTQPSSPLNAVVAETSNLDNAEQTDPLKFSYDEKALLKLPENRYLLQVAATGDSFVMQDYIQRNKLQNQLWVYKTLRNGSDWFVLLHNQSYLSASLAKQAVSSLPQALRQGSPFVKASKHVSQEIGRKDD